MIMYKEELNVLSYNILWRAIDAVEFMSHCKINNINECSQNIANIISKIGLEYLNTNSYDFIGLQEAKKQQTFQELLSNINNINPTFMNNYKILDARDNLGGVITMYNKNKFTLEKQINGSLALKKDDGRPFLISIYKEGIIHINVHMPHKNQNSSFKVLKKALEKYDMSKYRVIFAGDFNMDNPEDNNIFNSISSFKREPKKLYTCCKSRKNVSYYKTYDHIYDNMTTPSIYRHLIIDVSKDKFFIDGKPLMSDHLPVFAKFPRINPIIKGVRYLENKN